MNKIYVALGLILFVGMVTVPLLATRDSAPAPPKIDSTENGKADATQFKIYDKKNDKVLTLGAKEYIVGVVSEEMPADFSAEALKAQAVAAYTIALKRSAEPRDDIKGADLSNDSSVDQGYITKEEAKKKWGDKYDEYQKKVESAVDSVLGQKITYDGKPILAAYHAISGGKTESSKTVWETECSYLKPVASVGDLLAPNYLSTVSYTKDEFIKLAKAENITLSGEPDTFYTSAKCTESGTVGTCKLGGKELTGQKMRKIFSLRSANFDLKYADGKFTFTVRGYGHGVGMSQYGANFMAGQGSDYKEILKWYYTGCKVG